jgi:N-acetylmuramoyl-L-alanine amidase
MRAPSVPRGWSPPPGLAPPLGLALILALLAFAPRAACADAIETMPVTRIDGVPHLSANEIARVLDAAKFWRADVRKLVLRAGTHQVVLTVDNPFVLSDDRTVRLDTPVLSVKGEIMVPIGLLESLPRDSSLARLLYDPRKGKVIVLPPGGTVGTPRITVSGEATRITFPTDGVADATVANRSHKHFRVRLEGFFTGTLPDELPADGVIHKLRAIPSATGSAFEIELTPGARGFRIVREPRQGRVAIEFTPEPGPGLEAFAPEGPEGTRGLRVVALDPGHGGDDAGVTVGDAVEKDLTLALARQLKFEIERRLPVRVVLTRERDIPLTVEQRAQAANRARADLVLSLHFDGFPDPDAKGATAYCPPATFAAKGVEATAGRAREIAVLPWSDVATRHAAQARALADAVLGAMELHGLGPTRLRELLAYNLLGVNAPGIVLECATLTSPRDRARLTRPHALADLAAGIADGIAAYQKND